jgi:hypothetical protein
MDPVTGKRINMEFFDQKMNDKIASRVKQMPEDNEKIITKRWNDWLPKKAKIEKAFAGFVVEIFCGATLPEQVLDQIAGAVIEPPF